MSPSISQDSKVYKRLTVGPSDMPWDDEILGSISGTWSAALYNLFELSLTLTSRYSIT